MVSRRTIVAIIVVFTMTSNAFALKFWKNSVPSGNWSSGTNWSATGPSGADVGGVPGLNEPVRIYNTNGAAHTVTLDTSPPTLGLLAVDLPAAGALTNTLSLTTNNNLTAAGIFVGGHNGSGVTAGNGVLTQSAGTITTSPGSDLYLASGAGSTGVYNLSGGTLNANLSTVVGSLGTGTFNHSGGIHTLLPEAIGGSLLVGYLGGSNGIYNLSGTGQLISNKNELIGVDGVGQFFQTGGSNTINGAGFNLLLGYSATGNGTYTISGGTLTVAGDIIVGNAGAGTLTIQGQSSVSVGNILTVGNGDTVNLQGGTLRFNDLNNLPGSTVNYTGGTVALGGVGPRNIGADPDIATLFGASPTIPAGKALAFETPTSSHRTSQNLLVNGGTLTVAGTLNIGQGGASTVQIINNGNVYSSQFMNIGLTSNGSAVVGSGGNLTTDDLVLGGFGTTASLDIQEGGTVATRVFEFGPAGTLNILGGTLRLSSKTNAYGTPGTLNFSYGTISLTGDRTLGTDDVVAQFFGAGPLTIPLFKELAIDGTATMLPSLPVTLGGKLSAGTLLMTPGSRLTTSAGSVTTAAVLALAGSTIDATSASLTIGDPAKVNGFYGNGILAVGDRTVLLRDANDAVFDSAALVTLGSGASPGVVGADNGLTLDFGGNITGYGTLSTPNNIAKPLINNGHIVGNSASQKITLPGYVKGVGTFDQVNFTGTFSPGLSPTTAVAGSLAFSPSSTLLMELGGTTPGSGYDQLQASGTIDFDGTLQLTLINGFAPSAGQSFDLFDWADIAGTFDVLQLPTLAGLNWDTSQLYSTGVLSVVLAETSADYNHDNKVDAADYVVWRKTNINGQQGYNNWRAQFGNDLSGAATSTNIPEPATAPLLIGALLTPLMRARVRKKVSGTVLLIFRPAAGAECGF